MERSAMSTKVANSGYIEKRGEAAVLTPVNKSRAKKNLKRKKWPQSSTEKSV